MISYEDALTLLTAHCTTLDSHELPLPACSHRVLANDFRAPHDLPPTTTAAMDGYALRAADVANASHQHPATLTLIDTAAAGHPSSLCVTPGTCIAIMTGAELPPGADAVVHLEATQRNDTTVRVTTPVPPGTFIRPRGAEARAGHLLLPAGHTLTPASLGLAARCGRASLRVVRRPRVACVLTGDEIAPPGAPLQPGQQYDAIGPALSAALSHDGGELVKCSYAPDDPDSLTAQLAPVIDHVDVLLVVAGASVGAHDYTRTAFQRLSVNQIFWQVAIKPGKPLWFGVHGSTLVFNLPGNPVSALVTYYLFVRYALRRLQGIPASDAQLPQMPAMLVGSPLENTDERLEFVRATLQHTPTHLTARPLPARCSSMLSSLANANALIICPPHTHLDVGSAVRALLLPGY